MSKYDKSIEISHEEEGTYHRREIDCGGPAATSHPVTTRYIERYQEAREPRGGGGGGKPAASSRALAKDNALAGATSDEDEDNFQEWTTSKRKVNHKTRQVETRVSRQLLVRGGEVIADSGPQVTTRITEDNKVEESEKERTPKSGARGRFEALESAPESATESSGLVLGEKREIQRKSREVREENMQYHDERFKELTGKDVHRRAIKAPHELITINDKAHAASSRPRGKMIHYSNKGKKYQDTDEILEVAKLAIDGSITKEVKRTKHHEEFSEDELPDEKGEAEELRRKPVVERSSRRHADYVNDFDEAEADAGANADIYGADTSSPARQHHHDTSDTHQQGSRAVRNRKAPAQTASGAPRGRPKEDEAFPRYEIDPLLNSLRDEDFRPLGDSSNQQQRQSRLVEHPVGRGGAQSSYRISRSSSSSSDDDAARNRHKSGSRNSQHRQRAPSGGRSPSPAGRVEVPEEYRVNRQQLASGKSGAGSTLSHKSNRSQQQQQQQPPQRLTRRREDATTQARLTDEEVERHSLRSSSPSLNSHEKTAKYLQRQSTPNSSRRYYYGDSQRRQQKGAAAATGKRPTSLSSSLTGSLSSLDDPKARARQQGVQSRDSGFRSPHSAAAAAATGGVKQVYSTSKKSSAASQRPGAVSPAESAGQRSVKTTTTTLSAGLADRPLSRNGKESRQAASVQAPRSKSRTSDKLHDQRLKRRQRLATSEEENGEDDDAQSVLTVTNHYNTRRNRVRQQADHETVSLSSLRAPSATKIEVPYLRVIEIERERASKQSESRRANSGAPRAEREKSSSEMSFQEDIASLSKRLASISGQRPTGEEQPRQHFDYKTLVANVHAAAPPKQLIGAYNVQIQQQNSPFHLDQAAPGVADSKHRFTTTIVNTTGNNSNNNNELNFNLHEYAKYHATPALVDQSLPSSSAGQMDDDDDDDRMSRNSSCSLQSARTYNIRKLDLANNQESGKRDSVEQRNAMGDDHRQGRAENRPGEGRASAPEANEFDENGNGKATAWIFDPRDNSSTAIVPPARPKRPETPKVDSKTEELAQARGGRSYYLELVEPAGNAALKRTRPSSIDSLYSRWTSQGALNQHSSAHRPLSSAAVKQNRPKLVDNSSVANKKSALPAGDRVARQQTFQLRQLPFSGPPSSLGDRSKSSSCLLSVTKPSKYSIYGGFRKPGESNKPVPRLSYSRAIGPRSTRVDTTPSAPSRYLKMR